MYSYNFDFLDTLGAASILIIFFVFVILIGVIILWVFGSLGLMELAKKNNISNPWLAFIPVGCNYLLGKLGFEIYPEKNEKNPTLTWVLLGLSAGTLIFGEDDLGSLISIAITVFTTMAYYRIYKYMTPESATKYTILSFFFGGLPLFFNKSIIKPKEENTYSAREVFEKTKENQETQKEEINKEKPKFCKECGSKLNENAKFCTNCGKKIN